MIDTPNYGGSSPTATEINEAMTRILRSRCFEHAGRASEFLRFVVGRTLAGEGDRLKGYTIAIEVFGRSADFDAQSDPLVRVEALRLRQRLTEYYVEEGAGDAVRLDLPRGGYAIKAVYASQEEPAAATGDPSPREARNPAATLRLQPRITFAVVALALLGAVGLIVTHQPETAAEPPPAATQPPERAHRTKIAVVPLENLSDAPELDGLAAGLTEEIMLRLDDLDLFVIATQGKWYGSGRTLEAVLGEEHSYVLTGSVRNHARDTRITVRIIEAATGTQIWSSGYDEPAGRELDTGLQAKVARDVAAAAAPFGPVFDAELALARRRAHTLELPDCQTRYRAFRRATDPALFPEAYACFQSLVERRPELGQAWAGLAMLFVDEHMSHQGDGQSLERASAAVQTALALDSTNVLAHAALTRVQYYGGDPAFLSTAEKALALDPRNPEMLGLFGILLAAYGDTVHATELIDRAHELAPQPRPMFNLGYVFAHLIDGDGCAALPLATRLDAPKWFISHVVTAAAAGLCGNDTAAAEARTRLLAVYPRFATEAPVMIETWRFDPRLRESLVRGLRKAGFDLREQP
jgi:TolB-like protein/Tfp pilus assembly protein PilF